MFIHLSLECMVQWSVTSNHQVVIRERFEELGEMVDQGSDPLLGVEPADVTEHPAAWAEAPLLRRQRASVSERRYPDTVRDRCDPGWIKTQSANHIGGDILADTGQVAPFFLVAFFQETSPAAWVSYPVTCHQFPGITRAAGHGSEDVCMVKECLDKVAAYEAAGVTHFIFMLIAPFDRDQIQGFAEEVIPAVRPA